MSHPIDQFFSDVLSKMTQKSKRKPIIDFDLVEKAIQTNDYDFIEALLDTIEQRTASKDLSKILDLSWSCN